MAEMRFKHALKEDEIHRRLQSRLSDLSDEQIRYVREERGYRFTTQQMGFQLQGYLTINQKDLQISLKLPWLARPFHGAVEDYIKKQAEKILS